MSGLWQRLGDPSRSIRLDRSSFVVDRELQLGDVVSLAVPPITGSAASRHRDSIAPTRFALTTLNTRQTLFLVVLFVVTSLAFIQLDSRRALDPVKDAMRAVVGPVVAQIGNIGRRGDVTMEREISAVKAERDQLAAENAQLKAAVREVEQLRLQAKLQQDRPTWKMLQARVQTPDPTNQQKFLTIDKGAKNGVEVGMAVVAQGPNYIGQVTEVWEESSRVMLIVDVTQRVGARLEGGGDGVVFGEWQNGGRFNCATSTATATLNPASS